MGSHGAQRDPPDLAHGEEGGCKQDCLAISAFLYQVLIMFQALYPLILSINLMTWIVMLLPFPKMWKLRLSRAKNLPKVIRE